MRIKTGGRTEGIYVLVTLGTALILIEVFAQTWNYLKYFF